MIIVCLKPPILEIICHAAIVTKEVTLNEVDGTQCPLLQLEPIITISPASHGGWDERGRGHVPILNKATQAKLQQATGITGLLSSGKDLGANLFAGLSTSFNRTHLEAIFNDS